MLDYFLCSHSSSVLNEHDKRLTSMLSLKRKVIGWSILKTSHFYIHALHDNTIIYNAQIHSALLLHIKFLFFAFLKVLYK